MSDFYRSKSFIKLRDQWRERLRQDGFDDLEDRNENLKCHDTRTISFDNQEHICDFFIRLDHFMYYYPEMDLTERKILELYSQGIYIRNIQKSVLISESKIRRIISKYKKILVAVNRLILNTDFPSK